MKQAAKAAVVLEDGFGCSLAWAASAEMEVVWSVETEYTCFVMEAVCHEHLEVEQDGMSL